MSITGNRNRRGGRGFTLFELLIVLAILSLTAVFVVPQLGGGGRNNPDTVVRFVRGALDKARTLAKLTRKSVQIEFRPARMCIGDKEELTFPGSAHFLELVFPSELKSGTRLQVNRRGVAPSAIIRIELDGDVYSLLVSPVLSELEYRPGAVDFDDFNE